MIRRVDAPPDLARPDAGLGLFPITRVEPGGETKVADTIASEFVERGLPTFGLIAYNVFVGEARILHFTQLARVDTRPDIGAHGSYVAQIAELVPTFEVIDVAAARPYRSSERRADAPRPGRYSYTTVTLADPGPDTQRGWADAVLDANPAPAPESGLIATQFYLTMDATRVLALTEWTTAEAHQRATGEWDPNEIPGTPGTTSITEDLYRFAFALVPERADER